MKLLLLSLSLSLSLTCSQAIKYVSFTYIDDAPVVLVDNQPIRCHCGNAAVEINVLNGIVHATCKDHRLNK